MTEKLNNLIDVSVKLATPIGVVIMIVLQSQFVTRQEFVIAYDKIDQRIEKIEQVLIRMEASAMVDARHTALLDDHEQRIRTLEQK